MTTIFLRSLLDNQASLRSCSKVFHSMLSGSVVPSRLMARPAPCGTVQVQALMSTSLHAASRPATISLQPHLASRKGFSLSSHKVNVAQQWQPNQNFRRHLAVLARAAASHENSTEAVQKPSSSAYSQHQEFRGASSAASNASSNNMGAESSTNGSGSASSSSTSSSSNSSNQGSGSSSPVLLFNAGVFVLPHPDKMLKGGEDWYFISDCKRAIGVADGVGGWAEVGVDAGAYARQLMGFAKDAADAVPAGQDICVQQVLEYAFQNTNVKGSSTACLLSLNGNTLQASNLGDSGFVVLRGGKPVFHSPQQQHDFNFPYQLGSKDSMSDSPSSAQRFEMTVQAGDVVIVSTDGLWDNCFDEEIASVVKYCLDAGMNPGKTAQVMAHYARHRAADSKFASPFAYAAFQAGFAYMGGKMDDITVLVGLVTPPPAAGSTPISKL